MGLVETHSDRPCAARPPRNRRRVRKILGWLGTAWLAIAGMIGTNEALISQQQSTGSDIPKS